MELLLNEQQNLLAETAARLCADFGGPKRLRALNSAGAEIDKAAWRELKEETGIDKATLIAESGHWLSYDFPLPLRQEIWDGRFKGQTQKWFLMRFIGVDRDVDLDAHHAEFDRWRWAPPAELPAFAVDFKQALYRELLTEFAVELGLS